MSQSALIAKLKMGKHRHYSGKIYDVIGVAYHSETLEPMAVYRAMYTSEFGTNALWVRPLEMFLEEVEWEGKTIPRFEWVGESV